MPLSYRFSNHCKQVLLVNDLDLKVEHGSTESWGNRDVYNGNTPDRRNNVEAVFVNSSNTERIDLVIHVHGHNVPIGPSQPYALVVAGKIGEGSCSSAALPACMTPNTTAITWF